LQKICTSFFVFETAVVVKPGTLIVFLMS